MALESGSRLGPYESWGCSGTGAMGEVYRARDPRLEREVAIKVSPRSRRPRAAPPLRAGGRAAGALDHPNVLAVYDVGTHAVTPYVVSELLEGQTLRARLEGGKLPVRQALDYALQVAPGLPPPTTRASSTATSSPTTSSSRTRPDQDPRLRPGQADAPDAARPQRRPGHRSQGHGIGHGAGDGGLHVARAGPWRGGGPPLGHLLFRGGALRDAHGRASVPA